MPTLKRKAFAYITHNRGGTVRLLVFRHPNAPAAGIQVPAGTVEDGETPEAAVLREAREESGLPDLTLVGALGEQVRDMTDLGRDERHHRFFFHVRCGGAPPEQWRNWEEYSSGQVRAGHVRVRPLFEFFWARLPDGVPELAADHGILLRELVARLASQP